MLPTLWLTGSSPSGAAPRAGGVLGERRGALPIWEPSAPFATCCIGLSPTRVWPLPTPQSWERLRGECCWRAEVAQESPRPPWCVSTPGGVTSRTTTACWTRQAIPPHMLFTARRRSRRGRWTGFPALPKWSGRSATTARSFWRWRGRSQSSSPRRFRCVPSSYPRWPRHRRSPADVARRRARALAPSTLFQLPGARQGSLGTIAAILRRVPVFGLEVGPDLDAIPGALLPAIEGLRT